MLCSTRPSGKTGSNTTCVKLGGAPPTTHKGQCASSLWLVVTEPSAFSTTLTIPAEVQISNSFCGLTRGEATAAPSVKANHSRANLASQGVLRRMCRKLMGRDYGIGLSFENDVGQISALAARHLHSLRTLCEA
jgi:hypothetical protein